MIFGVFERKDGRIIQDQHIGGAISAVDSLPGQSRTCRNGPCFFSYFVPFETAGYKQLKPVVSKDKKLAAVFTGKIYNDNELWEKTNAVSLPSDEKNDSLLILSLYERFGLDFVKELNGKFAFALWDKAQNRFILGRDRFGIEPLYYYIDEEVIIFASSIPLIFKYSTVKKELNLTALAKFLLFNYNPSLQSLFSNIYKLRPSHYLVHERSKMRVQRYWKVPFGNTANLSENEIAERLIYFLRDAVSIRMNGESVPGVFLSGGMDSSTVLALLSEAAGSPLNTFSYRCKAESFDESQYARLMAETTRARHSEVEYSSQDVLTMPEIVKYMNEPFCDIGINIATYILGKEACQSVSYVLTGDGGDELFGGHPVYEADKIARFVDPVPNFLKNPFLAMLSSLPDSDKKKSLIVKIKRFSENLKLPGDLLSHRWRVYYSSNELNKLITPSFGTAIERKDLFEDILQFNREAEGPDLLSHALYSDYQTAVDFYLRRNDLNRKFPLETRFPLLDHRLVEFCATIPSQLKIRGWFDTKYIFKKAMEGILPHDIVYRKDKLGHSIPLKNWIRKNDIVREFILDFVSVDVLRKRGLFKSSFVQKMIQEHMAKNRNNSHRLWALAVLEMWLREHLDH